MIRDEIPTMRAFSDQIVAMFRETEGYHSRVANWVSKVQNTVGPILAASRTACTSVPVALRDDSESGGGRELAPLVDEMQPVWNKDDPMAGAVPVVILSWAPENRWVVRAPFNVAAIIQMVAVPLWAECCWHRGPVSRSVRPPSYLTVAQGQEVVGLLVCGDCRRRIEAKYPPDQLHWIGLVRPPIFHGDGTAV